MPLPPPNDAINGLFDWPAPKYIGGADAALVGNWGGLEDGLAIICVAFWPKLALAANNCCNCCSRRLAWGLVGAVLPGIGEN